MTPRAYAHLCNDTRRRILPPRYVRAMFIHFLLVSRWNDREAIPRFRFFSFFVIRVSHRRREYVRNLPFIILFTPSSNFYYLHSIAPISRRRKNNGAIFRSIEWKPSVLYLRSINSFSWSQSVLWFEVTISRLTTLTYNIDRWSLIR